MRVRSVFLKSPFIQKHMVHYISVSREEMINFNRVWPLNSATGLKNKTVTVVLF